MKLSAGVIVTTLAALAALPIAASAPEQSLRPIDRDTGTLSATEAAFAQASRAMSQIRPVARPERAGLQAGAATDATAAAAALVAVARTRPHSRPTSEQVVLAAAPRAQGMPFFGPDTSARPWNRPDSIEQKAMAKRRLRRAGAVCGDVEIQGEAVGNVGGKGSCGISDAVSVHTVAGVRLSQSSLMNCKTAQALKTWVERGVKPAFRKRGPVVEMKVAAHYACRTRNSQRGARLSEHAKGNAIDISAFKMKDGEVITVAQGWGNGTTLRPLRKAWSTACGPFGTVLGPQADAYHKDHFHVDTASYRSGPYCR